MQLVFDFSALAGLAGWPGCGQPRPGSVGQLLLFDFQVLSEPGQLKIVFDLCTDGLDDLRTKNMVKLPSSFSFRHSVEHLVGANHGRGEQ